MLLSISNGNNGYIHVSEVNCPTRNDPRREATSCELALTHIEWNQKPPEWTVLTCTVWHLAQASSGL